MSVGGYRCAYVVGLGASAGGLDPLEQFFDAMPPESGAAFVVVQHLSPDFKSLMKELLTRHTAMNVHRVEDDMPVEPNSIYLIPPQKEMRLEGGRLRLYDQAVTETRTPNFAIDQFFESLANDIGNRAIAVVLSGTGSDGSRGIRSVSVRGGLVVVQDPSSAQFDGMPRSAIATGAVHSVLSPPEIATTVYEYIKRLDASNPDGPIVPGVTDRAVIQEVVALLQRDDGVDFSHYRPGTIARRVSRRISITHQATVPDYLELLSAKKSERIALRNDLLIGVTSFFRDPPAWDHLRDQVVRPLVAANRSGPIRVWVTACSTGEEVYSLAMLLRDEMERAQRYSELKIFATDLDERALETAALGIFPASIAEEVGSDRIQRYFTPEGGGFRVTRSLREMVIFAEHNLTRDAAFTNLDIVTCRNALIYMEPLLQQRILAMLHFALKVDGTLFLGSAESLGDIEPEFTPVESKWKIFRKKRDITLDRSHMRRGIAIMTPVIAPAKRKFSAPQIHRSFDSKEHKEDMFHEALRLLLHEKDSACVIVDESLALVHATGRVDRFVRVPEGSSTQELTKMVDPSLALPLGAAFHRVIASREPVSYTGIALKSDPERSVDLLVAPASAGQADSRATIVLFEETSSSDARRPESPFTVDDHIATRIQDLEHELHQSRESLQATIEELETTNEENQATNEELLASNEELQSTNEELQSVNEELYTVNAEHQMKIQELTDLNNDMDNLLRSTQHGTLFLDERLRIRKFTPAVLDVVQLTEQDIGRPIDDFSNKTDVADLWERIEASRKSGESYEAPVTTNSGRELYVRCVPYTTDSEETAGLVVTFLDLEFVRRLLHGGGSGSPDSGRKKPQTRKRSSPAQEPRSREAEE